MQRRNIQFPDPLIERAEKVAEDLDLKLPEIIRRALEDFVERHERSRQKR